MDARQFTDWFVSGHNAAGPLADEMLALPSDAWDEWFASHPDARTVQVLEALVQTAEEDLARAPELTDFVLRHVGAVHPPAGAEQAQSYLWANVWKVRGIALREAGDAHGAMRAFEMSAAISRAEPVAQQEVEEAEREAAALRREPSLAARLLGETPYAEWPRLAEREELQHPGALAELSREAVARVARAPRESLTVTELAAAIADSLRPDAWPDAVRAQLRAKAWADRGQALRYLARYAESLAAFDTAEEILQPFGKLAHDRALLWLSRASTLGDANRPDEAAALLAKAREVFHRWRDAKRELFCDIGDATLLYRQRDYRQALEACIALLPAAQALNDGSVMAILYNDIAHAAIAAGEYATAEVHLEKAVTVARDLGQPLLAARSELVRGRMLLRKGDLEHALIHLHYVRDQFQQQHLAEEAGLCGLDIVEAHLLRGASIEAEALARQIIREFTAAQLNERAITALKYLREAIASRKASATTVESVREFLESLRRTPDAEFRASA